MWDHGIPADLWRDDLVDDLFTQTNKERCQKSCSGLNSRNKIRVLADVFEAGSESVMCHEARL